MGEPEVVVLGAGLAGLGAAIGLARRGVRVVMVDKDAPPVGLTPEDAFDRWPRRTVPQARQPHMFQARATNRLRTLAPDVLDDLLASGVQRTGFMLDLIPLEEREPEDDELRCLLSRRLPFELTLRRAVEAEPLVRVLASTSLTGVSLDDDGITGVVLDDGTAIDTAWLIDAAGRRSPVRQMLETGGATFPAEQTEDCSLTYFTRHFRRTASGPPLWTVMAVRADLGHLLVLGFPGDRETFSIGLMATSSAFPELGALRHVEAWDRVAAALPRVQPWVDPGAAQPLTDVLVMAGQKNLLRDFCAEGRPVVPGWLPVGDSFCSTNPVLALGASLALTHAAAAVKAVASGQPRHAASHRYHGEVFEEARLWFEESAAGDRIRTALLAGAPLDDGDAALHQKELLFRQGVAAGGSGGDALLLRAMMRRLHIIDGPDTWTEDDEVVRRATVCQAQLRASAPPPLPTRDELFALVAS